MGGFHENCMAMRYKAAASEKLAPMLVIKKSKVANAAEVVCPKCDGRLNFYRSDKPHIDECGFESYSLKCPACGSALVGIVDPIDDALLLSVSF